MRTYKLPNGFSDKKEKQPSSLLAVKGSSFQGWFNFKADWC